MSELVFKSEPINDYEALKDINFSGNCINPNDDVFTLAYRVSADEPFLCRKVSIEGLQNLIKKENLKECTRKLIGYYKDRSGQESKVVFDNQSATAFEKITYTNNKPTVTLTHFVIAIGNVKANIAGDPMPEHLNLNTTITVDASNIIPLALEVQIATVIPKIIYFRADIGTLMLGSKTTLSWKLEDHTSFKLYDNDYNEITSQVKNANEIILKPTSAFEHNYYLHSIRGQSVVVASLRINVLNITEWFLTVVPEKGVITNMAQSADGSRMFAVLQDRNEQGKTAKIYYSYEGYSDRWTALDIGDLGNDLSEFITSPLVHQSGQKDSDKGHLFFIGGSSLIPNSFSNLVAHLDLDKKTLNIYGNDRKPNPWSPRIGHSALVFPHGDTHKIWIMGGMDESGNALNDIWISGNGEDWQTIDGNGLIGNQTPIVWKPRCYLGAATTTDINNNKQDIYMGGGFTEATGKELADLYKWNKTKWERINNNQNRELAINNGEGYTAAGLIYLRKTQSTSQGVFSYGTNRNGDIFFRELLIDSGQNAYKWSPNIASKADWQQGRDEYTFKAISFKGCIWLISLAYLGRGRIESRGIYYWVPPKDSQIG
jgi:hypothetical protein